MTIDIEYLKSELKEHVSERRYLHSLGVAGTGIKLANKFGADAKKVEIAGILHDLVKYWSKEELIQYIKENPDISNDLLNYSEELWHGPVASIVIQEKYNITDDEIINAIRYHTSGRENMSLIEKIVCLADYIEPTRLYPGVNAIRDLAESDIDKALLTALEGTIIFLLKNKKIIYPLTIKARNYLIQI